VNIRILASKYFAFLDRQGRAFNLIAGLICAVLLGVADLYLDLATGADYTLAFFYLLPVSFVAWFAGRNAGIAISVACAAVKMSVHLAAQQNLALLAWKSGTGLAFFVVVALLLAKVRQLLDHERLLSRTDHLTGAVNTRAFVEATTQEILRLRRNRQPFTLAYIDLDNFKEVNDTYDHTTGDIVLRTVASAITGSLRRTDVVARLGGDEFAILLPETGEQAALAATDKIREQLHYGMKRLNMAVTCSIGVLTCTVAPGSADEIITIADNLMFEVKRSGKNGFRLAVYAPADGTGALRAQSGGVPDLMHFSVGRPRG
jgi:diguanylate cyclase (GGDEF)-like protein